MVVERREAQRARSRRFAQADRSVARATPEAGAGGNIRPRGVAHDPGASRRSTPLFRSDFVSVAFGKTRTRRRREDDEVRLFVERAYTGGALLVMPALVAGIHVLARSANKDVDGRNKSGHDGRW